jgi:hypothetical protein
MDPMEICRPSIGVREASYGNYYLYVILNYFQRTLLCCYKQNYFHNFKGFLKYKKLNYVK